MTKDQADDLRQDIENIVNKLKSIDQGLADQEFGETEDSDLEDVIINIDDGDIEGWHDDLGRIKDEIEGMQNKLNGHL